MSMQTDVKSIRLAASGAVSAARSRIKGYHIASTVAGGTFIFYNNPSAASGDIILQIDAGAAAGTTALILPGQGILGLTGIYCSVPASQIITVIYG